MPVIGDCPREYRYEENTQTYIANTLLGVRKYDGHLYVCRSRIRKPNALRGIRKCV